MLSRFLIQDVCLSPIIEYANSNNKAMVAGSDAHYANEIGNVITLSDNDLWSDIKDIYKR